MKNMFKQYDYNFTEQEYRHIWENSLFILIPIYYSIFRYQDIVSSF